MLPEGIQFTRDLQRLAGSINFTRKNIAELFDRLMEFTTLNKKGKVVFVWCGVRDNRPYYGMGFDRQLAYNKLIEVWISANSFKSHEADEIAKALNVSENM